MREWINQKRIIHLDGGMGTLLLSRGLQAGELPERWNITHAQDITDIHADYLRAGSDIISANTFGANSLKFSMDELDEIIGAAIGNAKRAIGLVESAKDKFVALDIGPTGRLLKPFGDFDFEEAVEVFANTVRLGVKHGADLIFIETMNDSYETKAAVLAAKENSDLPIFVSNAYGEDGKLMTGATPAAMVAMLEGLGVDALGANCSLGPKQLRGVVDELLRYASVPVILKPNAGLPCSCGGETHYDVTPEEFAAEVRDMVVGGVSVIGGCCGSASLQRGLLRASARGTITPSFRPILMRWKSAKRQFSSVRGLTPRAKSALSRRLWKMILTTFCRRVSISRQRACTSLT